MSYRSWEKITWRGKVLHHTGLKWSQSFDGGLPDSVSATGGGAPFSASAKVLFEQGVLSRFPSPWNGVSPRRGDPVTIEVYSNYPREFNTTFKLLIDSVVYSPDGIDMKFISYIDMFSRKVNIDPLMARLPNYYGNYEGESYQHVGGYRWVVPTPLWHVFWAFRAGGYHATPPPMYNCVLDLPLQGANWCNLYDAPHYTTDFSKTVEWDTWQKLGSSTVGHAGEIVESVLDKGAGSTGAPRRVNLNGIDYLTAGRVSAYDNSEKYYSADNLPFVKFMVIKPTSWSSDSPVRTGSLYMRFSTRDAFFVDINSKGKCTVNVGNYTEIKTNTFLVNGNTTRQIGAFDLPSGQSGETVITLKFTGVSVVVRMTGGYEWEFNTTGYDFRRVNQITVSVDDIGGESVKHLVGFAGITVNMVHNDASPSYYNNEHEFKPTARIYNGDWTGWRNHLPSIIGMSARDVLDGICKALCSAWWVTGEGEAIFCEANRLLRQPTLRGASALRDIGDYNISDDLANCRASVKVKFAEYAHCITQLTTNTVWSGGGSLKRNEVKEDFINPPADEDWFDFDDTFSWPEDNGFNASNGSYYGCIWPANPGHWATQPPINFDIERLGFQSWRIRQSATADVSLQAPDTKDIVHYLRGHKMPIARCRAYMQQHNFDYVIGGGIDGAGELAVDGGKWLEGSELAKSVASWLGKQLFDPKPVIHSITILYNPSLSLGSVVRIYGVQEDGEDNLFGAIFKGLIVGVSHDPDSAKTSLTIRVIDYEYTRRTWAENEALMVNANKHWYELESSRRSGKVTWEISEKNPDK